MNINLLACLTGFIWKIYDDLEDNKIKIKPINNILGLLVIFTSILFLYYDTVFLILLLIVAISNYIHLLIKTSNYKNAIDTFNWKIGLCILIFMCIYKRNELYNTLYNLSFLIKICLLISFLIIFFEMKIEFNSLSKIIFRALVILVNLIIIAIISYLPIPISIIPCLYFISCYFFASIIFILYYKSKNKKPV